MKITHEKATLCFRAPLGNTVTLTFISSVKGRLSHEFPSLICFPLINKQQMFMAATPAT